MKKEPRISQEEQKKKRNCWSKSNNEFTFISFYRKYLKIMFLVQI